VYCQRRAISSTAMTVLAKTPVTCDRNTVYCTRGCCVKQKWRCINLTSVNLIRGIVVPVASNGSFIGYRLPTPMVRLALQQSGGRGSRGLFPSRIPAYRVTISRSLATLYEIPLIAAPVRLWRAIWRTSLAISLARGHIAAISLRYPIERRTRSRAID
jgi:hypothetical protein